MIVNIANSSQNYQASNSTAYRRGQRLRVYYHNYPHEGIVHHVTQVSGRWAITIAHNSMSGMGVCTVPLQDFQQGCRIEIIGSPLNASHEVFIIRQIDLALTTGITYDMLLQNCEHFASWCYTGIPESPSIRIVCLALAAFSAIVLTDRERRN